MSVKSESKGSTAAPNQKPLKNIIEKIWDAHLVKQKEGHPAVFAIDLMLLHEVTSAQAFENLAERKIPVADPQRLLATIDHSIPTRPNRHEIYDEAARAQVDALRQNCKKHGIPFHDFDSGTQGIVHVIGPELGVTQPGMTIVCGDSHTSTHGAFGALAFGIGTSEVGHVLATGCLLQEKPKTMKVTFKGKFLPGVYAKDAILALIGQLGIGGATGHVIEYCGDAIKAMSMEERMTVCNMSIECGARAGLISPDETTYAYIKGRKFAPSDKDWAKAVETWQSFCGDRDASYDREVVVDLDLLAPMVTWGTNPGQALQISENIPSLRDIAPEHQATAQRALEYTQLREGAPIRGVKVDWAFIGSCTNGRIEDLRIAANILKGHRVAEHVTMYVVPGSEAVMKQAQKEGLDKVFEAAGAVFRNPGCSMCLGMNDDKVPSGKRCISSSNRNFVGRQGPGSITHLASPATVAASAIAGEISSSDKYLG
ncbi:MAG: 3-isopropylmalate dehydratase large subunit [Candidatus Melainabacteria bacterium]|nr:MAG: 3-isopropylmalate dehydratase large subunit [Candidatus Melainabacteria bacterium]